MYTESEVVRLYGLWQSAKRWRSINWLVFFAALASTKVDRVSLPFLYQDERGRMILGFVLVVAFSFAVSFGIKEFFRRRLFETELLK